MGFSELFHSLAPRPLAASSISDSFKRLSFSINRPQPISMLFFFSSRRRHTRLTCDWSSDVCSSDLHDVPIGWHGRVRATGGAYANPPADAWRFRDYTGGLGGLDVTGSYGTAALRGSLTLGGRHSDGYREQDR